ncbi:pheromone receptor [Purpureocillium lavendulum]|uniref:Pheromone receptor n=1 Tax=Purpureocillium lavendulum TaxID=1247861 RepID=A0AB34G5X5_9HYPO|nr:pheromone receptor [Purpureocillium lavendulum]
MVFFIATPTPFIFSHSQHIHFSTEHTHTQNQLRLAMAEALLLAALANARQVGDAFVVPVPSLAEQPTSLTVNLGFRVALGIIADLACLVPLWILVRNGEFAASLFVLNVVLYNVDTVVNSLIWRDNDTLSWWPGMGFCDFDNFYRNFSKALFLTCLLAIMRNLAIQVGELRAHPLSVHERRRRNLIQGLIIFPWPLSLLAWTYPLSMQRYVIGTLSGCDWAASPSWPYLVFFVIPPIIIGGLTLIYSILIFHRYRQLSKVNDPVLSTNSTIQRRSLRTRRRLYLMVISIIVPFYPIVVLLAVLNIVYMDGVQPFDYHQMHNPPPPFPWDTIFLLPSDQVGWAYRNTQYISILTAIPICGFFGTTRDAINIYRRALLSLGLGRVFPVLKEVYDPDRDRSGTGSNSTTVKGSSKILTSHALKSVTSSSSVTRSGTQSFGHDTIVSHDVDLESGQLPTVHTAHHSRVTEPRRTATADGAVPDPIHRNPFPFRTYLNLHLPRFGRSSAEKDASREPAQAPRRVSHTSQASGDSQPRTPGHDDDEARLNTAWAEDQSRGVGAQERARIDSEFTSRLLQRGASQV